MSAGGTTWALAIATYRREDVLPRCLRLAARQTRPPAEIVVVDGSPGWERTRERVLDELTPEHPRIRFVYEPARVRSSAAQRNQATRAATADVVFLIDDDSLLYPDCAEEILRVYEADARGEVVGVCAQAVDRPPPDGPAAGPVGGASAGAGSVAPRAVSPITRGNRLRRRVRRWLSADDRFVPYDPSFPRHPLPPEVKALRVGFPRLFPGFSMTWRRDVALREPFDERMRRYAAGEDSDMSYRASRHGALAKALDARLHHLEASGGRLPAYVTTALGALNPLFLHRAHSTDLALSARRQRELLRRRLAIELLKDLGSGDLALPRVRGIAFGLRRVDAILSAPADEVDELYAALQERVLTEAAGEAPTALEGRRGSHP